MLNRMLNGTTEGLTVCLAVGFGLDAGLNAGGLNTQQGLNARGGGVEKPKTLIL